MCGIYSPTLTGTALQVATGDNRVSTSGLLQKAEEPPVRTPSDPHWEGWGGDVTQRGDDEPTSKRFKADIKQWEQAKLKTNPVCRIWSSYLWCRYSQVNDAWHICYPCITYVLTASFPYSHVPAPGHNIPPHMLIPSCSMYSLTCFSCRLFPDYISRYQLVWIFKM